MLNPEHLRDLLVDPQIHPRGQAHLSAASGLVRVQRRLYVVADDEHHLGVLGNTGQAPLQLLRLLPGNLPQGAKERKRAKADLETLAHLPAMPGHPFGALLAMGSGSGSGPNRSRGIIVPLDASGRVIDRVSPVDLKPLYARLRRRLGEINIEGAFATLGETGDERHFCLLQRGNRGGEKGGDKGREKGASSSAIIRYRWKPFLQWLLGKSDQRPPVLSITPLDLGSQAGVPLSLTDGAAMPGGRWAFCAVAEDTRNSVDDGACLASAVGVVDAEGAVLQCHRLKGAPKVEGLCATLSRGQWELTMVTDADDPAQASRLLRVRLPKLARPGRVGKKLHI